jgi:hypothetical protein
MIKWSKLVVYYEINLFLLGATIKTTLITIYLEFLKGELFDGLFDAHASDEGRNVEHLVWGILHLESSFKQSPYE